MEGVSRTSGGGGTAGYSVPGTEGDVEYRVNTILGWELEEGDLIYLLFDGEGTYEVGTQRLAGQAETQIPGREPDLIS